MAGRGQNQGFHVLDDFVCEAIPSSSVTPANPVSQGRSEGISVVEEVVFDFTPAGERAHNQTDGAKRTVGISDEAKPTADWGFGLFAGVLAGVAFTMIFVEPDWITPRSSARRYVAGAGIVGAMIVMAVRKWFVARRRTAAPESDEP